MVMRVEPVREALRAAREASPGSRVVYLSPQGRRFDQVAAARWAERSGLILLAGRYEGIDERLVETEIDEEWSIGDYVLAGGELAAMVIIEAVIRLLPGALGHADSADQDSFGDGLLDCPHYTRPAVLDGRPVPPVLLSGDHEAIRRWRLQQALGRTWLRRPDLLAARALTDEERDLLDEFMRTHTGV
jgi:tRNA (guanine37-N1)-methyltransferase